MQEHFPSLWGYIIAALFCAVREANHQYQKLSAVISFSDSKVLCLLFLPDTGYDNLLRARSTILFYSGYRKFAQRFFPPAYSWTGLYIN